MQASLSLLVAVAMASFTAAAGETIWAKLSAYLKSPGRPFVLSRAYGGQTEFKCGCQGTGNKIFKTLSWTGNEKPLESIDGRLDKRFEKCYQHAHRIPEQAPRETLLVEIATQVVKRLDPCLQRLFNIVCCSTPEKILKSNADIYQPIDDAKKASEKSRQLLDFEDYCESEQRQAVTYPTGCPAEADQIF